MNVLRNATLSAGDTLVNMCTVLPPPSSGQSAEYERMRATWPDSMRNSTKKYVGGSRCTGVCDTGMLRQLSLQSHIV